MLYGCETGAGTEGTRFVRHLAGLTGTDVAASTNRTGHVEQAGDWNLELQVGSIETAIAFTSPSLEAYVGSLPIVIYAAGQTGEEQMELRIDNVTVQTWDRIGGDYFGGVFEAFTYHHPTSVTANQIQVAFTNDLYTDSIDRNLRVDRITIDDRVFQTESPTVYSTGTWKSADGLVPGFRENERLHANGYFQYSEPIDQGSTIRIRAAGDTGEERMELRIDGVAVQAWDNVAGDPAAREFLTFTFQSDRLITPDQVQIAFTNDRYIAGEVDRNLWVDHLEIDGVIYETEAANVFSTGTWSHDQGIQPGYRSYEALHANGYFQYARDTSTGPGTEIVIHAAGETNDERMELLIDGVAVAQWDGVGGDAQARQFVPHTYVAQGNIQASQIRVAFTNDYYADGVDRNLRVDRITVAGVTYQTEDPTVLSTATWQDGGFMPRFAQSEYLHANGFFQYAALPVDPVDPTPVDAQVVINEIHYNPGSDADVELAEFLELYNPGTTPYDLSGMSFVGFDLVFELGTILQPDQYIVVSPSIERIESIYGVTPIAAFASGRLSNGGEIIQLIAADGVTVVDEVEYSDGNPWPSAADGNGPSLELIHPRLDNANPANWRASVGTPTPGAVNSVYSESTVSEVTDIVLSSTQPLPGEAITVTATIANASVATLTYKVMFDEDISVEMVNIGGNQWQGIIPGQLAGTLVRYRIASDVAVAPFEGDSINYFGVVVAPTDIVDNSLPVFHWFVDPDEFDNLVTNLYLTNTKISAVVAYGDQVIDNAEVRVRGNSTRDLAKKGFKFELPAGYFLEMAPYTSQPVDEFGIIAEYADWTFTNAQVSWEVWNAETGNTTASFFTRIEQNSDFYGIYRFQELYDGVWREANGYDNGEFYEAEDGAWSAVLGFDKKTPSDDNYESILAAREILLSPSSASKTAWIIDNVDIPAAINYMALTVLTRHIDQSYHNFYVSLDGETGRWSQLPWDLDLTWIEFYPDFSPVEYPATTPETIGSPFLKSMWEVPEFQQMYWQRLRTLVDTYLADDRLIERRMELMNEIGATNGQLEVDAWGRSNFVTESYFQNSWTTTIQTRREILANESRLAPSALDNPNIVINELHYHPSGSFVEFLELYNASSQAVDLSGWAIDGVGLTIAAGTVILPDQYFVFTEDDAAFRSQKYGNVVVGGQYSGALSNSGETITLLNLAGAVIDVVTYDDSTPWPTSPDGGGYSLSLLDPALDNSFVSSWAASEIVNGTPGRPNFPANTVPMEIVILAAGSSGNEIIELEVNGGYAATFDLATRGGQPGDFSTRNFTTLTWSSPIPITPEMVRVYFVNDRYVPEQGIDYNVRIDRIEVNGTLYETEAPDVFSTGTMESAGYPMSEDLYRRGYFEYRILPASLLV